MNRNLCAIAFILGLTAVGWVAYGYIGSNLLALTMTLLIGAFYLIGAVELQRFGQATSGLQSALSTLPEKLPQQLADLGKWLASLHPSLRNPVRLRIEGERVGLPGPAMTPYLVGLLVLLGMLGTFLGMVVALNGAVMALETTTDLPTIRAALAAPVKGLGLAFGTSVAGVAASAMLGLVSALCRRERLQAAQLLDTHIATDLRAFSLAHQREQTLASLQLQARVMPEVVEKMQAMMTQMERHSEDLNQRLLAGQDRFYSHAGTAYSDLATSVDRSLKESMIESARSAGAAIQPVVEATMAGITRETAVFQLKMADTVQQQLDGLSKRFDTTVTSVAKVWTGALADQRQSSQALVDGLRQSLDGFSASFEQHAISLLLTLRQTHTALQADSAAGDQQRLAVWAASLEDMAASLQREWQQAGEHSLAQQQQICKTLEQTAVEVRTQAEAQTRETIAEMSRLIDTASQAPRAAAEVVAELRQKLSDSMARDNDMLEERSRIMGTLNALLDAVNQAATEQRAAIDNLVGSSAAMLQHAGSQFDQKIEVESEKMASAAAQLTGSAVDVASMGEAFGVSVQLFSDSSQSMTTQLQRIEAALTKSTVRSDEQLAYYVAQAREIVDLSISSQKQIVEDLQQLAVKRQLSVREAA